MAKYINYDSNVVFERVESTHHPGIYLIPFFSRYGATEDGTIVKMKNAKKLHQSASATSVGSYLTVTINSDLVGRVTVPVQILIALAFHGIPANAKIEVNHLDGIKHNNHYSNLEYSTKSENLIHAYETGLRKENRPILSFDHIDNTQHRFRSITALERFFNLSQGVGKRIVRSHHDIKYMDRFTFQYDQDQLVCSNIFPWSKAIVCKDYINDKNIIVATSTDAEMLTGVNATTVRNYLQIKAEYPIKGFVFKYVGEEKWPEISKERALVSSLLPKAKNPIKIITTDGQPTTYKQSLAYFAASIGEHPNTFRRAIAKNGLPLRFKTYLIDYVT